MPGPSIDLVLLRDHEGNTYLLPWEVLQQARVPDAYQTEIDHLISGDDVAGFGIYEMSSLPMSPLDSLRLQVSMERRAKFTEAVTNIMSHISRTQDAIIQSMR